MSPDEDLMEEFVAHQARGGTFSTTPPQAKVGGEKKLILLAIKKQAEQNETHAIIGYRIQHQSKLWLNLIGYRVWYIDSTTRIEWGY